jgi:hypothetical protein
MCEGVDASSEDLHIRTFCVFSREIPRGLALQRSLHFRLAQCFFPLPCRSAPRALACWLLCCNLLLAADAANAAAALLAAAACCLFAVFAFAFAVF